MERTIDYFEGSLITNYKKHFNEKYVHGDYRLLETKFREGVITPEEHKRLDSYLDVIEENIPISLYMDIFPGEIRRKFRNLVLDVKGYKFSKTG